MTNQIVHCSNCSAPNDANFKYCTSCGHEIIRSNLPQATNTNFAEMEKRIYNQNAEMLSALKSIKRGSTFRTVVVIILLFIVFLVIYGGCKADQYNRYNRAINI